jgi:hypothetical protein
VNKALATVPIAGGVTVNVSGSVQEISSGVLFSRDFTNQVVVRGQGGAAQILGVTNQILRGGGSSVNKGGNVLFMDIAFGNDSYAPNQGLIYYNDSLAVVNMLHDLSFLRCTFTNAANMACKILTNLQVVPGTQGVYNINFYECRFRVVGGTGELFSIKADTPTTATGRAMQINLVDCFWDIGNGTFSHGLYADDIRISRCFGRNRATNGKALQIGRDGEPTGNSADRAIGVVIEDSTFDSSVSHGVLIGAGTHHVAMRRCTVHGGDQGLVVKESTGTVVEDCIVYMMRTGGVSGLYQKGTTRCTFRNNRVLGLVASSGLLRFATGDTGRKVVAPVAIGNHVTSLAAGAPAVGFPAAADGAQAVFRENKYRAEPGGSLGSILGTSITSAATLRNAWAAYPSGPQDLDSEVVGSSPAVVVSAPGQVSGLTATAAGVSAINLAWSDLSTETSYEIQRSLTSGSGFSTIATLAANSTSFADSGLASATAYYYRVRGVNAGGNGDWSVEATATTAVSAPAQVTGLSATASGSSSIDLSWSDLPNETSYEIQRSLTSGSGFSTIATPAANTTTFADSGLAAATAYFYRVRGVNAGGNGSYSSEATATTDAATALYAPSIKRAGLLNDPTSLANLLSDGVETARVGRAAHESATAITSLRFTAKGYAFNGSAVVLDNPDDLTVEAAIEYPAGTFTRFTFGGNNTVLLAPGEHEVSDELTISIPADTRFWVRSRVEVASGGQYPLDAKSTNASQAEAGVPGGTSSQVDSGTISNNSNSFWSCYDVEAVYTGAEPPSFAVVGDSLVRGKQDSEGSNTSGTWNRFVRRVGGQTYGLSGSQIVQWDTIAGTHNVWKSLASHKYVFLAMGTNDRASGNSAASQQAALVSISGKIKAQRADCEVVLVTVPPKVSSSDNGATLAGQTVSANEAIRTAMNTWIRGTGAGSARGDNPTAFFGEIADLSALWEDAGDVQKWKAPPADNLAPTVSSYNTGTRTVVLSASAFTDAGLYPELGDARGAVLTFSGGGTGTLQSVTNGTTAVFFSNPSPTPGVGETITSQRRYTITDGTHPRTLACLVAALGIDIGLFP